jgi:hypothetical protein
MLGVSDLVELVLFPDNLSISKITHCLGREGAGIGLDDDVGGIQSCGSRFYSNILECSGAHTSIIMY